MSSWPLSIALMYWDCMHKKLQRPRPNMDIPYFIHFSFLERRFNYPYLLPNLELRQKAEAKLTMPRPIRYKAGDAVLTSLSSIDIKLIFCIDIYYNLIISSHFRVYQIFPIVPFAMPHQLIIFTLNLIVRLELGLGMFGGNFIERSYVLLSEFACQGL